ncbi:hypothetical protein C5167_026954 [Papaver somniferum]|nr:hypothetical protein C5167_026954 [Papaver somniferum]
MKRSKLETSNYLKEDCLNFHCTIRVVKTRVKEGKYYVIPIPPSNMSQNLKGLLESGTGFDVTIQVGNEFFKAHKFILAARSPVFKAYSLCTSTTIMQHLLVAADRFGLARLKLMCEAKLCVEITANNVATTLVLADKHQFSQLKTICLNVAAKAENVEKVLKSDGFADLAKSCPSLLIDLLKTGAVEPSRLSINIRSGWNIRKKVPRMGLIGQSLPDV